jgi:peroxiredoxin Q/BCP
MPLKIGDPAPDFSLPDSTGQMVNLSALKGKRIVLYFYPRDNTPGCTKEACAFRDAYDQFQAMEMVVLGVSTDDAKSHDKFITKFNLPFQLLIDEGGKVAEAYESYGLKKFMGKEYMGITRNTFVIDETGNIAKIYKKVKPETHIEQILADLD